MKYDLNATIIGLVKSTTNLQDLQALVLGGAQGPTGGQGGRPGSIIGQLPQTKVAYDQTEAATMYTVGSGEPPPGVLLPSGGPSLVDNLNHIRARLVSLEAGVADYNPNWELLGAISAGTDVGAPRRIMGSGYIESVLFVLEDTGTAGTTTVDIHKEGTTIFTTQGNRPSIAYNAADNYVVAVPDVTSFVHLDEYTLDVDAAATGADDGWVFINRGTSSGIQNVGVGGVNIKLSGVYQGTGTTLNLIEGTGITIAVQDLGNTIDITFSRTAGAAGDFSIWSPDAPPPTASDLDDEFSDNSFNSTLWTEFDPGTLQTISELDYGLVLDTAADAGHDICGVYQTIPSGGGNFTIVTKVSILCDYNSGSQVGLALWENVTSASDIFHIALQSDEAVAVDHYDDYQTWNSNKITAYADPSVGIYLRIRRNGTTYDFDMSNDGIGWQELYVTSSLPFTPIYFGLFINGVSESETIRGVFQFFRYIDDDVGLTGIIEGDRISVSRA